MPKTSTPDLEGLAEFSRSDDRDRAQFFVGREAPIKAIEHKCADAWKSVCAGREITSVTRLIQGAPGAGKTALLYHLEDRWRAAGPPAPLSVRLQSFAFESEEKLVKAIANGVREEADKAGLLDEAFRKEEARGISFAVGLGAFGVQLGSVTGGRTRTVKAPEPTLAFLKQLLPPSKWVRPLCLVHDEVQNLDEECRKILQLLHKGEHGLPLIPLYAGLANSHDVLFQLGLSRPSEGSVFTLGRMEKGEAPQVVEKMLAHYRVQREGATEAEADSMVDWPAELEKTSDRWPQHLHNAMRGLAKELHRVKGVLAEVDKEAALAEGLRLRQNAYEARVSPEMDGSRFLLGEVMGALPANGATKDEVMYRIEQAHRPDDRPGWRLPKGMDAEDYFKHLVHRGALQQVGRGRHACPIPSFQEYLLEVCKPGSE